MPEEYKDTKMKIICNDCLTKSTVPFHVFGHPAEVGLVTDLAFLVANDVRVVASEPELRFAHQHDRVDVGDVPAPSCLRGVLAVSEHPPRRTERYTRSAATGSSKILDSINPLPE